MAEPWEKYAAIPAASAPWEKYADAAPKPQEDAPFVKGLKTFTPPLGAGSVAPSEDQEKAQIESIRKDPIGHVLNQLPFVAQIKKIQEQLHAGKSIGDVLAESGGELLAGIAGAPPIPLGREAAPSTTPSTASKIGAVADIATSPETARALVKVLPKGEAILSGYDAAKAKFQEFRNRNSPQPPRVIRDPGQRGVPPPLNYEPMQAPAPPAEAPAPAAPVTLPSGRKVGGIQNQEPLNFKAGKAAFEKARGKVDPALDEIAKKSGFDNFASAPKEVKPLLENALAAEVDRVAQEAKAPAAEPPSELEIQMRDSLALPKKSADAPVVSPRNEALNESLKPKYKEQGDAVHAGNSVKMALRFAKALKESGYEGLVDHMQDSHWQAVSKELGESVPSPETRLIIKRIIDMGKQ